MRSVLKHLPLFIVICCLVSILEWNLLQTVKWSSTSHYNYKHVKETRHVVVTHVEKIANKPLLIDTPECKIVDVDPIDESLNPIIYPLEPFQCLDDDHSLFFVLEGQLYINSTTKERLLVDFGLPPNDVELLCCLRYIFRYSVIDDDTTYR